MDLFNLSLAVLSTAGQGLLHAVFTARLTGKRPGVRFPLLYLFLLLAVEGTVTALGLGDIPAAGAALLALYALNRRVLQNPPAVSWTASLLAFCISQLSFGAVSSLGGLILPPAVGTPWLCPLLLLSTAASLALCACCCRLALRCLSLDAGSRQPNLQLLLLPGLFFFAAELYLLRTVYRQATSTVALRVHLPLLAIQILGLGVLLCTLYAYRRICGGLRAQSALDSLSQAARAQRTYVAEAQLRLERTRAFRHDIQNHLTVLNGLLSAGETGAAQAYLKQLDTAAAALSPPCRTGSPAVDVLLEEKLEAAGVRGIAADVSLVLPSPCAADDFDLCVIFANALDNAIHACPPGAGPIRISGKRQGGFYLLSFENPCSPGPLPPMGTGLSNIRAVAEKYHGAMLAEKSGSRFRLDVLLAVPAPPEDAAPPE